MTPAFVKNLESIQSQTLAAIDTGREEKLFPTLTVVAEKKTEVAVMLGGSTSSGEMLEAIERFGYKCGRRKFIPDFVFFAAESLTKDGAEEIMLSGCSKDLEVAVCYLSFDRDQARKITPRDWSETGPAAKHDFVRVPAFRAMQGILAKAQAPWWEL